MLAMAQQAHGAGDYSRAAHLYHQVAPAYGRNLEFLLALAECRVNSGNPGIGADVARRAVALAPEEPRCHALLSRAMLTNNDIAGAERCMEQALRVAPEHSGVRQVQSELLVAQGRAEEAFGMLRDRLDANRDDVGLSIVFAGVAASLKKPDDAIPIMERWRDDASLSAAQRTTVLFRLGALYDAAGRYEDAWAAYAQANALRHRPGDAEQFRRRLEFVLDVWTEDLVKDLSRSSVDSPLPVFIVGMPRSGTTLLEQTLAAHPRVAGGGERRTVNDLVGRLMSPPRASTPAEHVRAVPVRDLDKIARAAINDLRNVSPSASRVTDKMPLNLSHLGPIWLCLPGARVIWCRRDPRDTCLSCFFHSFTGGHPYGYSLSDLGQQVRLNNRLMEHWKSVLDLPILEVRYESLVTDTERVAREMLEFLDLDWDDACRKPHESDRAVVTASAEQVRQPMYTSSMQRWKRYERHLEPLLNALGDAVDSD